jgi:two-component system sensor histidine kinase VicK
MSLSDPHKILFAFETITQQTNQVFFIYNLGSQEVEYVGGAFEKVFDCQREEFLRSPQSLMQRVHPEDRAYIQEMIKQLDREDEKKNGEFRLLLDDENIRWICLTAYTYRNKDGERVVTGFVEDITKSKEYTFNLLKYNAKKDSTLEILSHDLASPMNNLQGLARLVAEHTESYGDTQLKQMLELMQETCKRGVELIRDFVAAEFLESSNVDLKKQRVDIVEKVRSVIDNYQQGEGLIPKVFQFSASRKKIFLYADDMKFMQVINNLISNAIKFTPDGGMIATRVEDQAAAVLITVQDNGVGIPQHLQAGLFEKFTKARRPGLKGEKSTGLGMSIIKTIVEWHGGKIWFESKEGEGSTFFIQIPKE